MEDTRNKDIGTRLSKIRNVLGLSQYTISKLFDITNSAFSLYERGERPIPMFILTAFCDRYGVSSDYLIGTSSLSPEIFTARLKRAIQECERKSITDFLRSNKLDDSLEPLYLSGCFIPNIDIVVKLSLYLECSSDYLLGLSDTPQSVIAPPSQPPISIETRDIFRSPFDDLIGSYRDQAITYLNYLHQLQEAEMQASNKEA